MRPASPVAAARDATASLETSPLVADFKQAMRLVGAQVCIVAAGRDDNLTGMTLTSLVSLSLSPPAVTLAVAKSASIHPVLAETRRFGVSGLTCAHAPLADRFAGRDGSKGAERFSMGDWTALESGAPLLADAAFALDCVVDSMVDWRTHSIVVGRVLAIDVRGGESLMYREGGYCAAQAL